MSGYITATELGHGTHSGVHFRSDESTPVAACGLNFSGIRATHHPVSTGGAFTCGPCREAWKATRPATCRHCGRRIINDLADGWVDPAATGDDSMWRETCDQHDTFAAEHEPVPDGSQYRVLRSTSTYVDGYVDTREFGLCIPDVTDPDTLAELLQPESGAGHFGPNGEAVDAYYEIESIDGLEPRIHWEATG